MSDTSSHTAEAVYAQTNDAATNEVLAFERLDDGQSAPLGRFATSGRWTVGDAGELVAIGAFDGVPETVAGLVAS